MVVVVDVKLVAEVGALREAQLLEGRHHRELDPVVVVFVVICGGGLLLLLGGGGESRRSVAGWLSLCWQVISVVVGRVVCACQVAALRAQSSPIVLHDIT